MGATNELGLLFKKMGAIWKNCNLFLEKDNEDINEYRCIHYVCGPKWMGLHLPGPKK